MFTPPPFPGAVDVRVALAMFERVGQSVVAVLDKVADLEQRLSVVNKACNTRDPAQVTNAIAELSAAIVRTVLPFHAVTLSDRVPAIGRDEAR